MAALAADHEFMLPKKEISSPMDMGKWMKCGAYHEYEGFITTLNVAVRGKTLNAAVNPSEAVNGIVNMINQVDDLLNETPAIDQPQRFGNKAFTTFYKKVQDSITPLLRAALAEEFHKSLEEISLYFTESLGNSTRIDYGTGHEMSFVMFMYCLFRIGALDIEKNDDKIAAVTKIFSRYMSLVRKLQVTYRMEPAGSHGVWSLDDFQFMPFIWGSSQFVDDPVIEPSGFMEPETVKRLACDYLFIGCIEYILQVKTGPFHEHSNQLWNISGTQSWTKINQGLLKMYKAEVLAKFPVVQHVMFGSLLSIKPNVPSQIEQSRPPTTMSALRGPQPHPQLKPGDT